MNAETNAPSILARIIDGDIDISGESQARKPATVRLLLSDWASAEALSRMADTSLNDAMNMLIDAGLETVLAEISKEKSEQFSKLQGQILQELLHDLAKKEAK